MKYILSLSLKKKKKVFFADFQLKILLSIEACVFLTRGLHMDWKQDVLETRCLLRWNLYLFQSLTLEKTQHLLVRHPLKYHKDTGPL